MHRGISRNYSLIALVLLFTGTLPVALAGTNVPDWVKAAASEKLPEYSPKTEAVVLLEETTLNVQPNGKSTERVRRVVKILRPQGRNDADVVISFNSDSKVNSLHVWSIGPDGREYAMKDNEIIEVGRQEWGILYQDLRMKVAEPLPFGRKLGHSGIDSQAHRTIHSPIAFRMGVQNIVARACGGRTYHNARRHNLGTAGYPRA
jgi:hypothetical protein